MFSALFLKHENARDLKLNMHFVNLHQESGICKKKFFKHIHFKIFGHIKGGYIALKALGKSAFGLYEPNLLAFVKHS